VTGQERHETRDARHEKGRLSLVSHVSCLVSRRFLVVVALMYWIGGFTFYAAVVVPVGTDVLGSAANQAAVTRQVAHTINLSGAVALCLFVWDIAATRRVRVARWLAWAGMAACLVALMVLYPHLDRMFHGEDAYLDSRAAFRPWHRAYLWTISVQWGFAVLFTLLTLVAWRADDRVESRG
jgi:hypothetical protein